MRKGDVVTVSKVWYLIKKIYQAVNEVPTFNIKSLNSGKLDSLDKILNVHSKQVFNNNETLTDLYTDVQRSLTGFVPERITFSNTTYTGTSGVPVSISWTHVGGNSPTNLIIRDSIGNIDVLLLKSIDTTSYSVMKNTGTYYLSLSTTSGYTSEATLVIT